MIDNGDIPSIQRKINLRMPKSMREIDDLSLSLIDFYVPALTQRLNITETSLKLSENIILFPACRIYKGITSIET
jgi:hypothetical protein